MGPAKIRGNPRESAVSRFGQLLIANCSVA